MFLKIKFNQMFTRLQDSASLSVFPAPGKSHLDGQIKYQKFRAEAIYEMTPNMDYKLFYNRSGL